MTSARNLISHNLKSQVDQNLNMRFLVHHYSHYEYTSPITLGPHTLRLVPQGPGLSSLVHDLQIVPTPVFRTAQVDGFGNQVIAVAFSGTTNIFRIDSRFEVVTAAYTPSFDPGFLPLPWRSESVGLSVDKTVVAFALKLAADVSYQALPFVDHLNRVLHSNMKFDVRLEGGAQDAAETLRTMKGACRDATVLFMDCCRALGLMSRFVSGYQSVADTPDGQRHLHAWPEVYLPGLGWRGYDPTHGLTVADGHILLCAAPSQGDTMPVEGGFSFIGSHITSTLKFGITISTS